MIVIAAYPAAVAERVTPRDDQHRGEHASVSHVDIATLPSTAGNTTTEQTRPAISPAVRIHQPTVSFLLNSFIPNGLVEHLRISKCCESRPCNELVLKYYTVYL